MGAGMAYDSYDPHGWYRKHKDTMILHPVTRYTVERLLEDKVPSRSIF